MYSRGLGAYYSSGSRPNTSAHAWAAGRVRSFATGKGGARKADKDLLGGKKKTKKKTAPTKGVGGNSMGRGLYYNINKKRKEGRKMRKKGAKGAPTAKNFKDAAKTARKPMKKTAPTKRRRRR